MEGLYQRLIDKLKGTASRLIIEGADPMHDMSYKWMEQNEDLMLIEKGIPLFDFGPKIEPRNLEMEYRVSIIYYSL